MCSTVTPNDHALYQQTQLAAFQVKDLLLPLLRKGRDSHHIADPGWSTRPPALQFRAGYWTIKSPYMTADSHPWHVIYWPVFLPYVLNNVVRSLGNDPHALAMYSGIQSRYLRSAGGVPRGDADYEVAQRARNIAKTTFETQVLPPGATAWYDSTAFRELLGDKVESPSASDYTVFRWGKLTGRKNASLTQVHAMHEAYHDIHLVHHDILGDTPLLFQVLHDVLEHAVLAHSAPDSSMAGYDRWGLLWTPEGLLLDVGKAVVHLQLHYRSRSKYPGDVYTSYLDQLVQNDSIDMRPGRYKMPQLSKLIERPSPDVLQAYLAPFAHCTNAQDAVKYQAPYEDDNAQALETARTASECVVLFPSGRSGYPGLDKYINHLLELSRDDEFRKEQKRSARALQYSQQNSLRKARKLSKRYAEVQIKVSDLVDIDNPLRNDVPDNDDTLDLSIMYQAGYPYISLPSALTSAVPDLYGDVYFTREGNRSKLSASQRAKLQVSKLALGHVVPYIYADNKIHYALALLMPQGELENVIDIAVTEVKSTRIIRDQVEALHNFLLWVNDPTSTQNLSEEMRAAYEPTLELKTAEDRVKFFYSKASVVGCLALTGPLGDTNFKAGVRSPSYSTYEAWCLHTAMTEEIPNLPNRLTRLQMCTYIAHRWLPWRRINSLGRYIDEHRRIYPKAMELVEYLRKPRIPIAKTLRVTYNVDNDLKALQKKLDRTPDLPPAVKAQIDNVLNVDIDNSLLPALASARRALNGVSYSGLLDFITEIEDTLDAEGYQRRYADSAFGYARSTGKPST